MFDKKTYEVTVDLHIRAKIPTQAYTEDEAYANVMDDYDDSSISEFLENYDWEAKNIEIAYVDIKDEPY